MSEASEPTTPDGGSSSIIAHCRHCDAIIGTFYNNWMKITGSYYLPSLIGSYNATGLKVSKEGPKLATNANALEGW